MSTALPFGDAIREARGKRLSQAKLAALLGVAPSTIYRIERGERPSPRVEDALRKWSHIDLPAVERAGKAA